MILMRDSLLEGLDRFPQGMTTSGLSGRSRPAIFARSASGSKSFIPPLLAHRPFRPQALATERRPCEGRPAPLATRTPVPTTPAENAEDISVVFRTTCELRTTGWLA